MEHEKRYIDLLDPAEEIDYRRFGTLLRKRKGDKTFENCSELIVEDVIYRDQNVIKEFQTHFANVLKENKHYDRQELLKTGDLQQLVNANPSYELEPLTSNFTFEEIKSTVNKLNKRKSPGIDNIL